MQRNLVKAGLIFAISALPAPFRGYPRRHQFKGVRPWLRVVLDHQLGNPITVTQLQALFHAEQIHLQNNRKDQAPPPEGFTNYARSSMYTTLRTWRHGQGFGSFPTGGSGTDRLLTWKRGEAAKAPPAALVLPSSAAQPGTAFVELQELRDLNLLYEEELEKLQTAATATAATVRTAEAGFARLDSLLAASEERVKALEALVAQLKAEKQAASLDQLRRGYALALRFGERINADELAELAAIFGSKA